MTNQIVANLLALQNLEELFETNPDQLTYWYNKLSELEINDLESRAEMLSVLNAMSLIMQYEHTNAEELKEITEREAVEMAEKVENWEMEKEMLKEEISDLRERIISKVGFDETNETFRAEIDSLTSENAYLKQIGRERDRELSDQRDVCEELSTRLQNIEKERTVFVNNQSQLEDQIRELSRRLNSSKDNVPQRNDWESRKLRQRSDQAVLLSNQLQNVITQNDELKAEVLQLTSALENATLIIQESTTKYANYSEQLSNAQKTIEQLSTDNSDLKKQLEERNNLLSTNTTKVKATSKEFSDVLTAKDFQIEQLRSQNNIYDLEIEKLRARLELHKNDEREEELERLRNELILATETARKLFGAAMLPTNSGHDGANETDPKTNFCLRIMQLDNKLVAAETQVKNLQNINLEMENTLEQKDLLNARLNAENQKIRQMAFGEANSEIIRLENKIEYRDNQIQKLNHYCTLLQVELQQRLEAIEAENIGYEVDDDSPITVKNKKKQKIMKKTQFEKTNVSINEFITPKSINFINNDIIQQNDVTKKEPLVEQTNDLCFNQSAKIVHQEVPKFNSIESSAALVSSLYQEIVRLTQDLKSQSKECMLKQKLYDEREKLFLTSKKANETTKIELQNLKAILFSNISDIEILEQIDNATPLKFENEIARLRSTNADLELENMEFKRFNENMQINGDEHERRIAETSRRLVFLAIQNSKLERRAETNERLRRAIAQDHTRLNTRLQRLFSGEDCRSRQLTLDNEVNLIEIARLQNTLLHSVPLTEYNYLLQNYKSILHKETFDENASRNFDAGYHSETAPTDTENESFDISKSAMAAAIATTNESANNGGRWADEILAKNKQFQEENSILRSQNEFWQKEIEKKDIEINELNAFLTDIENENEMKSMIANIERRFLHAIREQFDSVQEQLQGEQETQVLRKQMQLKRREWRAERQIFIKIILNLQNILRKLNSNRSNVSDVSIDQLAAFKKIMISVKERENLVERRLVEIEKTSLELETKTAIVEASRASIENILQNDYQLQYIQANLQGYQLNVLSLSSELCRLRNEFKKAKQLSEEKGERCNELQRQLDEFNFSNIDFSFLAEIQAANARLKINFGNALQTVSNKLKQTPDVPIKSVEINYLDSSDSDSVDQPQQKLKVLESTNEADNIVAETVIIDNSKDYEQNVQKIQNAARLCVQNYQEQLKQKDRAIKEYRLLIESLQVESLKQKTAQKLENQERLAKQTVEKEYHNLNTQNAENNEKGVKTYSDLSLNNEELELREYTIFTLQLQLRRIEETNADLSERLNEALIELEAVKSIKNQKIEKKNTHLSNDNSFIQDYCKPIGNEGNIPYVNENVNIVESQSTVSSSATSDASGSDSGTVEDMDIQNQRRSSNLASITGSSSLSKNNSGATDTIVKRPLTSHEMHSDNISIARRPASVTSKVGLNLTPTNDVETIVFRHRNETRRLRMRIVALERQNKQIMDENLSLKERTRLASRRPLDPNAEVNVARKENESLQRTNKNLTKSLHNQKEELDALQKQLKKLESINQNKISSDVWEERKRHLQSVNALKQRIANFEANERQLQERLTRRENYIEQLNHEHSQRFVDVQRVERIFQERHAEKTAFEKKEVHLKNETQSWIERHHDASTLLESALKENKILKNRSTILQTKLNAIQSSLLKEPLPTKLLLNTATQTNQCLEQDLTLTKPLNKSKQQLFIEKVCLENAQEEIICNTFDIEKPFEDDITQNYYYQNYKNGLEFKHNKIKIENKASLLENNSPQSISCEAKKTGEWDKIHLLTKQLRRAELLQLETMEQLQSVKNAYEELLKNYQHMVRIDMERLRQREESAALALLKDKLVGKDQEINHRRHKIVELERKVFQLQMSQCKCKATEKPFLE